MGVCWLVVRMCRGFGVGGKIVENCVMDGQKDNYVISTAYRCLLLRPILIVSGAFGQTIYHIMVDGLRMDGLVRVVGICGQVRR